MDLAVTIIHQHVGAQWDQGWIYRHGDIGRGSAAAGGDAIGRVIRGLPATLLANAVMRDRHIVDTMAFCQKRFLDQRILRLLWLLSQGVITRQPPIIGNRR